MRASQVNQRAYWLAMRNRDLWAGGEYQARLDTAGQVAGGDADQVAADDWGFAKASTRPRQASLGFSPAQDMGRVISVAGRSGQQDVQSASEASGTAAGDHDQG